MLDEVNTTYDRFVLLNRLVSRNVTQARDAKPKLLQGSYLFDILHSRFEKGNCIEFFNVKEDSPDDEIRKKLNKENNFIQVSAFHRDTINGRTYISMLVTYVDQKLKSFPVVDITKFMGRDLVGSDTERGSFAAHVVVRLPSAQDEYDDGSYRCAIEAVPNLSRANIEFLLCRQLRRVAEVDEWTFDATRDVKGRPKKTVYRYHPRLELFSDVGRSMFGENGTKELSYLEFTHRHEKLTLSGKTAIDHEDFVASVKLRISAKQGPENPEAKKTWLQGLKNYYELRGYSTRLSFRHNNGNTISGAVSPSIAGATDLLMCQRETIKTSATTGLWMNAIQTETRDKMRDLLDRDSLWKRAK